MRLRSNEKGRKDSVGMAYGEVNMMILAAAFVKSTDSSLVV